MKMELNFTRTPNGTTGLGSWIAKGSLEANENETTLETGSWNITWCVLVLLLYFLIAAVNYGLVHYENVVPDTHHTLINKMVSILALYRIAFATVTMPALAIMTCFRVENLGTLFCWMIQFGVICTGMQIVIGHNELLLLRYVYTCRLSTVGSINEDLIKRFFIILNALMGVLIATKLMFAFGSDHLIYQYCKGESMAYGILNSIS